MYVKGTLSSIWCFSYAVLYKIAVVHAVPLTSISSSLCLSLHSLAHVFVKARSLQSSCLCGLCPCGSTVPDSLSCWRGWFAFVVLVGRDLRQYLTAPFQHSCSGLSASLCLHLLGASGMAPSLHWVSTWYKVRHFTWKNSATFSS